MIFFTADQHFFHANIIKSCRRMFDSVSVMNEHMITRWNNHVTAKDTVYVLGDISWNVTRERIKNLIGALNGKIILIPSLDHDKHILKKVRDYVEIVAPMIYIKVPGRMVLCHYPMASWTGSHYGVYMLHGHCHGRLKPGFFPSRCDVGVDAWDYQPVTFDEIRERTEE